MITKTDIKIINELIDKRLNTYALADLRKVTVFVYGTLKRGGYLNYYLGESAEFIREATVKGELYAGSIPYLFTGDDTIKGELWTVPMRDFKQVRSMEESAGYQTILEDVNGTDAFVFRFDEKYRAAYTKNKSLKRVTEYDVNAGRMRRGIQI